MSIPYIEPDFEIPKGNTKPAMRQHLRLVAAVNLTGATVKLRYKPEGSATPQERNATIIGTPVGGLAAATEVDVEYQWATGDVAVAGRFEFQWVFILADTTPHHVPVKSPRNEKPDRVWQVFEVVDVI